MFIFHKTEVQRIILICLMGLNFNWFKSYGLKCILRLKATLANSQKNGHFMTISGHFFSNFIFIFHKTEVQTVTLRCWPSLNLNWNKFYNLKSKKDQKQIKPIWAIFYKITKKWILCHNSWANYGLDLISILNWPSESQFCERLP